ncbi:MAG TPA: PH domain-containing protein [Pirellulales bacterium]|jgi:hypothetical protein|nr:PH domain-containing protein [Pirellulales bacterium]
MKQAIAGVIPSQLTEATVTIEWPTIAATGLGRFLGRLYAIRAGFWIFTLGRLVMALTMPIGLLLFFWMLAPGVARRYRLTNRRVIVENGPKVSDALIALVTLWRKGRPSWTAARYVDLDRFNTIEIEVRPGQEWYPAGDLVFKLGNVETLRLTGVGHPDVFRATCLKAHQAYVGVRKAIGAV